MAAELIDGKALAATIRQQVAEQAAALRKQGRVPKLVAVLVGDDPSAAIYAKKQGDTCGEVKIDYERVELPGSTPQDQVIGRIDQLNADPAVSGVIVQLPLPDGVDAFSVQSRIAAAKDVEGVSPTNFGLLAMGRDALVPCTAAAAFACLKSTGVELKGKEAVVIGRSNIVGKPMQMLMMGEHATVTQCHTRTVDRDFHTRRADILVVAAGRVATVTGEHVKPGAIVIDVGINRVKVTGPDGNEKRKTVGDVDFESASQVAGKITPVPGGVGPVTVATLLQNVVHAAGR